MSRLLHPKIMMKDMLSLSVLHQIIFLLKALAAQATSKRNQLITLKVARLHMTYQVISSTKASIAFLTLYLSIGTSLSQVQISSQMSSIIKLVGKVPLALITVERGHNYSTSLCKERQAKVRSVFSACNSNNSSNRWRKQNTLHARA
jgi:hypothetical protein